MNLHEPFISPVSGNPVRVLLADLVDNTGLLPPARHTMTEAVHRHAQNLAGTFAHAVGRFIVPMHRLAEFEFAFARLPRPMTKQWRLSVLAGINPVADSAVIKDFNRRHQDISIVAVETKAIEPASVAANVAAYAPNLEVWVEVPVGSDPKPFIKAIKAVGRGAILRTGGVTAAAIPSPLAVTRFLAACRAFGVVTKATGGLYHPWRGEYRLQGKPDSPTGTNHGFINLILTAELIRAGGSEAACIELLNDTNRENFALWPGAIVWRGLWFGADDLAAVRQELFRSFGSCYFTELVDDLRELGWL
jgi:hypothetical protein